MKHFILLLSALALLTACGSSRRVSAVDGTAAWVGHPTLEILQTMGNPDSIGKDGKDGSILHYSAKSDYESPSFDILDPDAKPQEGGYADFYVDREGDCYMVDTNMKLPGPKYGPYVYEDSGGSASIWVDILVYLPLLLIGILL